MNTVTKIIQGQEYIDSEDKKKYIWMGSTSWAVLNKEKELIDVFSTKWAAINASK